MNELSNIIAENFWLLLLLIAMITSSTFRVCGIILIASIVFFGYHHGLFAIVVALNIIAAFSIDSTKIISDRKNKKDKKDNRVDPDYE